MFSRHRLPFLRQMLAEFPAVAILGPRQVGKTKRSSAPAVSRGFHIGSDDLKATRRFVVHAGKESFPMGNDVVATTLADLQQALIGIGARPR